jgi:hypothetical protein
LLEEQFEAGAREARLEVAVAVAVAVEVEVEVEVEVAVAVAVEELACLLLGGDSLFVQVHASREVV